MTPNPDNRMSGEKKYRVVGYCYVPTEAKAEVTAKSPEEAIEIAQKLFRENRRSLIDSQSGDESGAFAWEPTAEEIT